MKKHLLGFLTAGLIVLSAASAAQAANVTLRVEGKDRTVVPQTTVALPSSPVLKDGTHACAATSFGGALQSAVGSDWTADYFASYDTYLLTGIKGYAPAYPDYFALWVNHKYTYLSVCDPGLQEGDDILALVDYCDSGPAPDYACLNDSVLPLAIDAPKTVAPGAPFTVTVKRYEKDGTLAPVAGANLAVGDVVQTTNASGQATVTAAAGPNALRASKTNFAAVDATVCATDGADGFCGTTKPGDPIPPVGPPGNPPVVPVAPAVQITGITEQQTFAAGKAPRTLSGTVSPDPDGIKKVQLRLTRNDAGKCSTYAGKYEKWLKIKRCSASLGRWFTIGDRQDWTYLLPQAPSKGRYVLDVRAVDNKLNVDTSIRRGHNRIVFFVK